MIKCKCLQSGQGCSSSCSAKIAVIRKEKNLVITPPMKRRRHKWQINVPKSMNFATDYIPQIEIVNENIMNPSQPRMNLPFFSTATSTPLSPLSDSWQTLCAIWGLLIPDTTAISVARVSGISSAYHNHHNSLLISNSTSRSAPPAATARSAPPTPTTLSAPPAATA